MANQDKWVCIAVADGKVDNVQIGTELECHQHAEYLKQSYSEEELKGVTQIIVFRQWEDDTVENVGEYH